MVYVISSSIHPLLNLAFRSASALSYSVVIGVFSSVWWMGLKGKAEGGSELSTMVIIISNDVISFSES